jgi:hypothetical protein
VVTQEWVSTSSAAGTLINRSRSAWEATRSRLVALPRRAQLVAVRRFQRQLSSSAERRRSITVSEDALQRDHPERTQQLPDRFRLSPRRRERGFTLQPVEPD